MMRCCSWAPLVVAIVTVLAGLGGGCAPAVMKCYSGPDLAPGQEATLVGTETFTVERVRSYNTVGVKTIRLKPEKTYVGVVYHSAESGMNMSYRTRQMTIEFHPKAGTKYVATGIGVNGYAHALIVPESELKSGELYKKVMSDGREPVTTGLRWRGRDVGRGTATVTGAAYGRIGADLFLVEDVHLLKKTKETAHWANVTTTDVRGAYFVPLVGLGVALAKGAATRMPDDVKANAISVVPQPNGAFTFRDVAPGTYYLVSLYRDRGVLREINVPAGGNLTGQLLFMDAFKRESERTDENRTGGND